MTHNHTTRMVRHPARYARVAAISVFFLLAGCAGGQIGEDIRIPLVTDTSQSGSYSDFDFEIDYRYVFRQSDPQQPGQLELKFRLKRKRGFYSFTAFVNYLDAQGRVLGKNAIYSLGNRSGVVQIKEGPFETPPGTVAIAYSSVARDYKSRQ